MKEKYNMEVGANAWKEFLEKNLVKKGENEMNIKETLNKIYGKSAATNTPIKDDIIQEDITNAIKTIEEEEWIWVKGFKGTDKNMQCKGNYQYELSRVFDMNSGDDVELCYSGFHFCKDLKNVFRYYTIGDGNRFFEVEALVKKSDWDPEKRKNNTYDNVYSSYGYLFVSSVDDKYAAKSIRFIRELTADEVFEAVSDKNVREWTDDWKKRAMETSIQSVRMEIREFELCAAGYSPAFSKYIARDTGRYKTAIAMASLPDVSMDVKVMAIFMDNQEPVQDNISLDEPEHFIKVGHAEWPKIRNTYGNF